MSTIITAGGTCNVTQKPDLRFLPNGQTVSNINVAHNERWTAKDGTKRERVIWAKLVAWGADAVNANKFLVAGSIIAWTGTPIVDDATGNPKIFPKRDGTVGVNLEFRLRDLVFVTSKEKTEQLVAQRAEAGLPAEEVGAVNPEMDPANMGPAEVVTNELGETVIIDGEDEIPF